MRTSITSALRPCRAALTHTQRPTKRLPIPTTRRFQSQIIYRPNGETIRQQEVHFRSPPFWTWRRMLMLCLYSGSTYLLLKYVPKAAGYDLTVTLLDDDDEEEEGGGGGGGEGEKKEADHEKHRDGKSAVSIEVTDDIEAAEDSIFIPMTWAQKLPRTYYKGTDPEWQAFIQVASNQEKQRAIIAELLEAFRLYASKNPALMRPLGGPSEIRKHWLDMSFPEGPPQEYVRSGLEIGDGYLAWSQQRIEDKDQARIQRALWPKAVFASWFASLYTRTMFYWSELQESVGLSSKDPNSFDEKYKAAVAAMEKEREKQKSQGLAKTQTDPDDSSTMESSAGARRSTDPAERPQKALWPLPPVHLATDIDNMSDKDKLRTAMASHAFSRTLTRYWNKHKVDPPRGTFFVNGIIELHGDRGRMVMDVKSLYDPKQGRFVAVVCAIKHFSLWKQSPRG